MERKRAPSWRAARAESTDRSTAASHAAPVPAGSRWSREPAIRWGAGIRRVGRVLVGRWNLTPAGPAESVWAARKAGARSRIDRRKAERATEGRAKVGIAALRGR